MKSPVSTFLSPLAAVSLSVAAPFFAPSSRAELIHSYQFNNSLADELGGPSLVANGPGGAGTLGASSYVFGPNQGLSLSSGLPDTANYSLLVDFGFSEVNSYRKIIDFKARGTDFGLYNLNGALTFYSGLGSGPAGTFQADTPYRLVITRDGGSNAFNAYVDGVFQFTFADSGSNAVFTGTDGIIYFAVDDGATGSEASGGVFDQIAVFDSALSAAEVGALGGPGSFVVPEPGTVLLGFVGLAGMLIARRRLARR